MRWLGQYLKATRDKGIILRPIKERVLVVSVDADFVGNWDKKEYADCDTARSRHSYYILYAGGPLVWKLQLETKVALSSTESEYMGLLYALREAILIMNILNEMNSDWKFKSGDALKSVQR